LKIDFAVIATLDEEYKAVKEVFQLQEKVGEELFILLQKD